MHGYSNTETWECYNWLTADDDTYKRAVELAKGETPAKALEAYCWELMGDITPFADSLLELVFDEVNWQEIITTLTE